MASAAGAKRELFGEGLHPFQIGDALVSSDTDAIAAERLGTRHRIATRLTQESRDRLPFGAVQLVRDGHHRAEVERAQNARARHVLERVDAGSPSIRGTFVTRGAAPLVNRLAREV